MLIERFLVVGDGAEEGESVEKVMGTIVRDEGRVYVTEVKMYDVRIAQRQAPTSDIVEWNVVIYNEIGGARRHRLEE